LATSFPKAQLREFMFFDLGRANGGLAWSVGSGVGQVNVNWLNWGEWEM